VRIDRVKGKIGFASVVEVLQPAPVRVEPPCPYFGRCGGCDFQQLTYEAQLDAKVQIIRDCLHRIAKVEAPLDITMRPSPAEWHYRARANWQVDSAAKFLGYFERGSNRVCDVEYCAILVPGLQGALEHLHYEILADPPDEHLRDIDAVVGDEGISVAPPLAGFKTDIVSRRIGNETYYISAEAFFQVNHELLEPLIAEALRGVQEDIGQNACGTATGDGNGKTTHGCNREQTGRVAIDLYCGVGLFTLPLARRFERVVGVEAHPRAADFARRNLESAKRSSPTVREVTQDMLESPDLGSVEIVTARVGDWLTNYSHSFGPVDFLLLDPPRTGCENRDIAGILALRPAHIAYVSCDPATLARDLKKLMAAGYSLDSVVAFDMFPQTHHVETVARLSNLLN
jgi:23S rRNA (uracil1939-C5)-methyltransferase